MSEKAFKIPELEYFSMGGKYSGCKRGMKNDDFNFRITPKDTIKIDVWHDIKCFEKSTPYSNAEFELNRDGYINACDYIEEQFNVWLKEHSLRDSSLGYFSL